jgi:hypothetical protein
MLPFPFFKGRPIKPEMATVILLTGMILATVAVTWRARISRVTPAPSASLGPNTIDGIATELGRAQQQPRWQPRRWFAPPPPVPPLEIPPPVVPQPRSPEEVWPETPLARPLRQFTDVPVDGWMTPILTDLAQRQLITGFPDGSFRPDQPMTRAEFATQLMRLFALAPRHTPGQYSDLTADHWAATNIQSALQMGFLSGYPDQTFRPEASITRLQVILALASGLSLKSSGNPDRALKAYPDYQQVPPWARAAVVAALEADVVVNYPDTTKLEPHRLASRAEVITMLRQALVYTGQLSPLPPGQVPPPDQPAY